MYKRSDLIKKLLPGFLPLLVFIVADSIWGTTIGLYVAIGFGIFELAYTFIKEKRFDKFILFDTLLLVALGLVSLLLEDPVFIKLKPALIEAILCVILGISAFSSKNLMLLMSKRYMKDVSLNPMQLKKMNNSIRNMFWIFSIHTVLIIYAAYFLSDAWWGFISVGLFYIIFGLYFLYEFLHLRIEKNKMSKEEQLPLVDENGKVIGVAPRSACHQGPGMMHPVVHLHVFNNKGQLYLQKRREDKLVQPGKWDTAVGGHVSASDDIDTALKREAEEELGITGFKPQHFARYKWETEIETELIFMFVCKYDGKITIDPGELSDGKFWSVQEIEDNIDQNLFTPNFIQEFEMLKANMK